VDAELSALLAEGRAAYDRGDMARAEHCFTEALEGGAAEFADVHHALGVVYHSWGLYAKARARLEEALRLNPKYAEASLNLAITYNDMGRYAEAQELLSASKVGAPSDLDDLARSKIANLHAELGDAYRSAGLAGEAAVEYRRALGLCPTYVDIRARLARALADSGDTKDAIDQLRLALTDKPNYVPAMLHLGLLCAATGDAEGGRKVLDQALQLDPENGRAKAYLRMLERSEPSE